MFSNLLDESTIPRFSYTGEVEHFEHAENPTLIKNIQTTMFTVSHPAGCDTTTPRKPGKQVRYMFGGSTTSVELKLRLFLHYQVS